MEELPDACFMCGRQALPGKPLLTCADDASELICHKHQMEMDGQTYCPVHWKSRLDQATENVRAFMAGKHGSPPPMTSVPQLRQEIILLWEELEKLSKSVESLQQLTHKLSLNGGELA